MATPPFAAELQAALKGNEQGGVLYTATSNVVNPRFFCCISGNTVGVTKDPIARFRVWPAGGCSEPGDGSGTWFSCDVDLSYSATSTIASYEITWGDGAGTGPQAWPQGAPDTHQYTTGGTTAPIYYTITVTVTDLLGATSEETFQVAVVDCSVLPDIEMFAACGSSGLWYTADGGRNWIEVGATVFNGVPVLNLAVNYHTLTGEAGHDGIELWAITTTEMYRTRNSGREWELIQVPSGTPAVVFCSWYDRQEIFCLAQEATPYRKLWLHRSGDSGATWSSMVVVDATPVLLSAGGTGSYIYGKKLVWGGPFLATSGWFAVESGGHGVRHYSQLYPGGDLNINQAVYSGDGFPFTVTTVGTNGILQWTGAGPWGAPVGWGAIPYRDTDMIDRGGGNSSRSAVDNFNIYVEWPIGTVISFALPHADARHLIAFDGHDFIATPTRITRFDWNGGAGAFSVEWTGARTVYGGFGVIDDGGTNKLAAAMNHTSLLVRTAGAWAYESLVCGENILCLTSESGYVGTTTGVYQRTDDGYVRVYNAPGPVERILRWYDGTHYHIVMLCSGADAGIWEFTVGNEAVEIPDTGRQFFLGMSADGGYIYYCSQFASGETEVWRVAYDLSGREKIVEPIGSWVGIYPDPFYTDRLYVFGDMGAASKVLQLDEYGDVETDITDGGWGAGEVVRPFFADYYDPRRLVAYLSNGLEVYTSTDEGETWAQVNAAAPFDAQSGVMDWINPENIIIGRTALGADPIQLSPNSGVEFIIRDGGLPANAIITAIVVTA
jgi:hypothetical protein